MPENESRDVESLRAEVRSFLRQHYDPQMTVGAWWRVLADSGWGFPTWPAEWFGKGLSKDAGEAVLDELDKAGVLMPPIGGGVSMAGPVILKYGTDEQKRRWLPGIVRGEDRWGQFFSEPGAGSDLASVQTRAVRDGDEWIVNGQKVWNSGTLVSTRALLVARTDIDAPKHKGLSFFMIVVDQPGIEVRPIKQMNGYAEFNETFLTDARVADADRLGGVGEGWAVALAVLNHERGSFAGGGTAARSNRYKEGGRKKGDLDRSIADVLNDVHKGPLMANALHYSTTKAMVELARTFGRLDNPGIRQRIAESHALSEAIRLTALRGQHDEKMGRGGSLSSVSYVAGVKLVRMYRDLIGEIAGPWATLWDDSKIAETITTAPCHGIQGGSEQIQRNVIGERILGLPKEPQVDRDVPFRLLKVGTQRE